MLLEHQKRAKVEVLDKLNLNKLCILEGETRSGKTLTALSCALDYVGEAPFLFLTTKKALGGVKGDWKSLGRSEGQMSLINYHSVHKLELKDWKLAILDECHSSGLSSFPKRGKIWQAVNERIRGIGAALLMSGTVAIESRAQFFNEVAVTGLGPWAQYRDFYSWWRCAGHYKDGRLCGGYGIQDAVKSVGSNAPSWGDVVDYAQVDEARVVAEIEPFMVDMDREGFAVRDATLIPVTLHNKALAKLIRKIKWDKVVDVRDSSGELRSLVYDKGPASVLQACHMAAGGTLKDEEGNAFVLGEEYDPDYRVRWIAKGMKKSKKYAIHTAYIYERQYLKEELSWTWGCNVFDDLDELKASSGGVWVGSLESYAEGFDMSWLDGSQILYSLVWKGSKFAQVCDRQLRWDRKEKAKVAIPLLEGGIDSYVYEAVSNKRNFNASVL